MPEKRLSQGKQGLPSTAEEIAADSRADEAVEHGLAEAIPLMAVVPAGESIAGPDLPEPGTFPNGEAALVLERKHPLAIRWMHWINFPVLFV